MFNHLNYQNIAASNQTLTRPNYEDNTLNFPAWVIVQRKGKNLDIVKPIEYVKITQTYYFFPDEAADELFIVPINIMERYKRETGIASKITLFDVIRYIEDEVGSDQAIDKDFPLEFVYAMAHTYVVNLSELRGVIEQTQQSQLSVDGILLSGYTFNNKQHLQKYKNRNANILPFCRIQVKVIRKIRYSIRVKCPIPVSIASCTQWLADIEDSQELGQDKVEEIQEKVEETEETYKEKLVEFNVKDEEIEVVEEIRAPPKPKVTNISGFSSFVNADREVMNNSHGMYTDALIHYFLNDIITRNTTPPNFFVFSTFLCVFIKENNTSNIINNYGTTEFKDAKETTHVLSSLIGKDYILIPWNHDDAGGKHWALYVVYKPFESIKDPVIFIFDSSIIGPMTDMIHGKNATDILAFLDAHRHIHSPHTLSPPKRRALKVVCPQQPPGSNACGSYMIKYIKCILEIDRQELITAIVDQTRMDIEQSMTGNRFKRSATQMATYENTNGRNRDIMKIQIFSEAWRGFGIKEIYEERDYINKLLLPQ